MIRVLVVDDSAVMRGVMTRIVNAQPDMTVAAVASDPLIAMERLRASPPDVITLDVEMPRMDGLEFLRRLMQWRPLPVVMVSSLTARGADTTLRALELGAVDFIAKPALATADELEAYAEEVADKLRAAAGSRVTKENPSQRSIAVKGRTATNKVIVIGASTGGVEALRTVLTPLPASMPPILVAQHMPAGFTRSFARRLDAVTAFRACEAEAGMPVAPGTILVAPGGAHLELATEGAAVVAHLAPPVAGERYTPGVDRLFRSAAKHFGPDLLALVLTGMGDDGAAGAIEVKRAGGNVIAESAETAVIFGMPQQAIRAGAVDAVLPLDEIPGVIESAFERAKATQSRSSG